MTKYLMMRCLIISISILLSATLLASAAERLDLRERLYNVESGLGDNEINSMLQDDNGFLWFATNNGISRFDGYQFRNFRSNFRCPDFLMSNKVLDMTVDNTDIWLVTQKGLERFDQTILASTPISDSLLVEAGLPSVIVMNDGRILTGGSAGLFIYDQDTGLCKELLSVQENGKSIKNIRKLFKDRFGNIWIGTWAGGVYQIPNGVAALKKVSIPTVNEDLIVTSFAEGRNDEIYIGTWGSGIIRLKNHSSNDMQAFVYAIPKDNPNHIDWNIIYDLEVCDSGYIWAGSPIGLRILRINGDNAEDVDYSIGNDKFRFHYHEIMSLFKDSTGSIWASDHGRGVVSIALKQSVVKEINFADAGLNSSCIMAVHEDEDGILWLGVNGQGVVRYDQSRRTILHDRKLDMIAIDGNAAVAFVPVPSRNLMFVSTRYKGVYMLHMREGEVTGIKHFNTDLPDIRNAFTTYAVKDSKDNIWVGTRNGIVILRSENNAKDDYSEYEPEKINQAIDYATITCLCPDSNGGMWLGTDEYGLIHLVSGPQGDYTFHFYNSVNCKLSSNTTTCIYQDRKGRLWVGTKGNGLSIYDPQKDIFRMAGNIHLFSSNEICSISEDSEGRLWISTNNGIICYDSESDMIKSYGSADGLSNISFMANSVWFDHNKIIYGGYDGLSIFFVSDMLEQKSTSRAIITDISIFNRSIIDLPVDEREEYASLMPPYAQRINLGWKDKGVTFTFASPDFTNSAHVKYAYRLDGLDKEWHYVTSADRNVTYNNLSRGEYTFMVKAAGPTGIWTEPNFITVKITPAPWLSIGAILSYIIFVLASIFLVLHSVIRHIRLRKDLEIEQIERLKSDEVNNAKLTFFTNVSHEIFTPITIMSVSLEKLMEKIPEEQSLNRIITSNMDRLKRLLQQIMEFRKAESSNLRLKVEETDIVRFVKNLCYENFHPLSYTDKNIDMVFSSDAEHLIGYADTDKLDKILFNLISNAYKYNRKGGSVMVNVSREENMGRYAVISVRDTGLGISRQKQEGLFKRFYEGDYREFNTSGNGIGLSLTKDLVCLHKGSITVESVEGEGSVFTIKIPIDKESYSEDQICSKMQEIKTEDNRPEISNERSCILIVEDNVEFLFLMKNIMSEHYSILTAENGKEAMSILSEGAAVDLIITDFMMPEMDGAQLCRMIRSDIKFSHLPVIMLSARSVAEYKLESFAAGVDAYVAKPFEIKVLKAQVDSLIANRKMLTDNYRKDQTLKEDGIINTDLDRQFIEKAVKLIEEHLAEPEFNINEFSIAINMSGSTLYRKIKGLTGMSPKEFIRNIRFKYACKLLLEKSCNISEVAYRVGFSDSKYFSLCFKKEFGISPSQYISNNRKETKIDLS